MDEKIKDIIEEAKEAGFTVAAPLDLDTLDLKQEVRDMCAANTCGMYGKNWACPPGCGELSECKDNIKNFTKGIIVQTVGEIEDSLDYESMMEIQDEHDKTFRDFADVLREKCKEVLCLGTGTCTVCKVCTFPEEACRFPEKQISSMESYGVLVSEVCKDNGIAYYYGPNKISYTACYLIEC